MLGRGWIVLLGVVLVILVVSVAVPVHRAPRGGGGNETAAIATLLNISSAQTQFQAFCHVDRDGDGIGEFGWFAEMSAKRPLRGGDAPLYPPVLSGAFRRLTVSGRVPRSGYWFRIFLPSNTGFGVAEDPAGRRPALQPDPDDAERIWCAYAWPIEYDHSGNRTFFVNETGEVLSTDCPAYSGKNGPAAGAAFLDGGERRIIGRLAIGTTGQDGCTWRQVN